MTQHNEISSVEDAPLSVEPHDETLQPGDAHQQPETTDTQAPASPRASRARDRIQQLVRERQAAEALAQRSMAEAAALRERLQNTSRAADFQAPEDFTRAVAENAVREVGADMFARQAAQAREVAARAAQDAWSESTADFRDKVPDFDAVAHNPDLPVTPIMADAIRESERGAEIAYYLGKNPGEAARIAALPPVSQATAIARLEARAGAASMAVSRAPQPVTTLSGRSGSGGKRLEDMNFEEYRQARGF